MKTLRFQAVMKLEGINPYVVVTKTRATELRPDWKKPMPVLVRVNGMPKTAWPINLMPKGEGRFFLYLHEQVRKASGTGVGDRIQVELAFNSEYKTGPTHPMSPQFKKALSENKNAKTSWDALNPSRQKEILRYFAGLKSDEAKDRNLTRALGVLSGEEARFMARSWKNGK